MLRKIRYLGILWVFSIVACVTVNVYFPAAAIQKAADEIVEDVRTPEGQPVPQGTKDELKDKQGWLIRGLSGIAIGTKEVYAQINIDVSTPAIRSLKQSMRNDFFALKPYYEKGNVGENNKGYVEIHSAEGLELKEKADVQGLVEHENSARASLYSEIARANKLGPEVVSQIQKIFANSWRSHSRKGWWIQNDNGTWERK